MMPQQNARMLKFLKTFYSFSGRLHRVEFFKLGVYASIIAACLLISSIPLFASDKEVLRAFGFFLIGMTTVHFFVSYSSIAARRLHDLGMSALHLIWLSLPLAAAEIFSYSQDMPFLVALPGLFINLGLLLYPGQKGDNKFGVPSY